MDDRRKRILFRASHRGMQETDLLLGGFARARLADLPDDLLGAFEALLDEADNDLFNWLTGKQAVPARHDNALMRLLIDHKNSPARP